MQEALDIYIKLLIAIISFIAPLLINLLSIFSDGIAVKKKRLEEYESQTAALVTDGVNSGANITQLIAQESALFEEKKKKTNAQLLLLDPKKQILSIFPTFFYSLLLILINRLIVDVIVIKWLNWYDEVIHDLAIFTFITSICFAFKGVMILKNVVWAIIEVKEEIANDEAKRKQQERAEKLT